MGSNSFRMRGFDDDNAGAELPLPPLRINTIGLERGVDVRSCVGRRTLRHYQRRKRWSLLH
jgi:hypothetical protein